MHVDCKCIILETKKELIANMNYRFIRRRAYTRISLPSATHLKEAAQAALRPCKSCRSWMDSTLNTMRNEACIHEHRAPSQVRFRKWSSFSKRRHPCASFGSQCASRGPIPPKRIHAKKAGQTLKAPKRFRDLFLILPACQAGWNTPNPELQPSNWAHLDPQILKLCNSTQDRENETGFSGS